MSQNGILSTFKGPICILNKPNENRRVYKRAVWDNVLKSFDFNVRVAERRFFLYDDNTEEDLTKVAGVITKIEIEKTTVYATIDLVDTKSGRRIHSYLKALKEAGQPVPDHLRTSGNGDIARTTNRRDWGRERYYINPSTYCFTGLNFQKDPGRGSGSAELVSDERDSAPGEAPSGYSLAEMAARVAPPISIDELRARVFCSLGIPAGAVVHLDTESATNNPPASNLEQEVIRYLSGAASTSTTSPSQESQ